MTQTIMDPEKARTYVKRMQRIVFRIICDIDDFCRENHITYYLSGGSCLGAIRHKGFIPWDDDGDLMMPRKDYNRFIELFPKVCEGKYGVGSIQTDDEWQRPYIRVYDLKTTWKSKIVKERAMGVLVDVFPIDGVPSNGLIRRCFFARLKVLNVLRNSATRLQYQSDEPGILIKKTLSLFVKPIGARYFAKRMEKVASRHDFDKCPLVACSVPAHYGHHETIRKELMSEAVLVPFEGRMLPVPTGYDTYLSNLYGDYMTVPKDAEENGFTHLDAWDVDLGPEDEADETKREG